MITHDATGPVQVSAPYGSHFGQECGVRITTHHNPVFGRFVTYENAAKLGFCQRRLAT